MKKCQNCNQYFLLRDGYSTVYCDRIPDNEKKSCKEIGATRKYAAKVKNDPILQVYSKSYKTHFARIKYRTMTKQEFNIWSLEAKKMRDKALSQEITIGELTEWLKI